MNQTEVAVLGLIAFGPKSGYEIKREVEEQLGHFWSTSYGNLYPLLKRLADRDLLSKRRVPGDGRPDRHEYSLTPDGWIALKEGLAGPIAFPRPRNELLLRLFLAEFGPTETILRGVDAYREMAGQSRLKLEEAVERVSKEDLPPNRQRNWILGAQFGVLVMRAIEEWCELADRMFEEAEGDG